MKIVYKLLALLLVVSAPVHTETAVLADAIHTGGDIVTV